jgi:hypothetical protein
LFSPPYDSNPNKTLGDENDLVVFLLGREKETPTRNIIKIDCISSTSHTLPSVFFLWSGGEKGSKNNTLGSMVEDEKKISDATASILAVVHRISSGFYLFVIFFCWTLLFLRFLEHASMPFGMRSLSIWRRFDEGKTERKILRRNGTLQGVNKFCLVIWEVIVELKYL